MKKPEPFWEEFYRDDEKNAFSEKANSTVIQYRETLQKMQRVLDMGCGEGQNALYVKQLGVQRVEAVDISEAGISKLKRKAEKLGLNIEVKVGDLTQYEFCGEYDAVMSFGTFHFVCEKEWKAFVKRAKAATRPGGLHIMQMFTDDVPITEDLKPFAVGLSKKGELTAMYADWEILESTNYVFEDQHGDLPVHLHSAEKIVARKKEG